MVVILATASLFPLHSFLTSYNNTFGVAQLILAAWLGGSAVKHAEELYLQEHLGD